MSIISTILGVESSGGYNLLQGNIGDINNATGNLAQGYFQIVPTTWAQYGGLATGYANPMDAPYATQLQIAQNIPVNQWGPATQSALANNGYTYSGNTTLGQLLNQYGESPTATTPADGSSPGSSPLGTSVTIDPNGASEFGGSDVVSGEYDTASGLPYDTGTAYTGDTSNLIGDLGGIGGSGTGNDQGTPNLGGGITSPQLPTGQQGQVLPGQQNTGEASIAGQAVQKGLGQAGTDVQQAAGGIAGTLTSAILSLETYTSEVFVVVAIVVVGVILIAYGLGLFKHGIPVPV